MPMKSSKDFQRNDKVPFYYLQYSHFLLSKSASPSQPVRDPDMLHVKEVP